MTDECRDTTPAYVYNVRTVDTKVDDEGVTWYLHEEFWTEVGGIIALHVRREWSRTPLPTLEEWLKENGFTQ
jgi:hypothetical protein